MEELLKEVALSERKKQQIDVFVQTVTKLLQNVQETREVEVCSTLAGENVLQLFTFPYSDQIQKSTLNSFETLTFYSVLR